jgi:IrrE N-terminal-like domain
VTRSSPIKDLYDRLEAVGFPRAYVRESILPDWWEDELAREPGNRRLAELVISRTLKIPLASLVDAGSSLTLEGAEEVRFKRRQDVEPPELLPAVAIARRIFELLFACARNLPAFALEGGDPEALRELILSRSSCVDLPGLLQSSWELGVPVVHLDSLPKGAKRVDGMAFCVAGRPCIALASFRKSPAWLTWHLAHEMGHVARGHLRNGAALDVKIDFSSEQVEEREANLFAKDLVYGRRHRGGFKYARHINGAQLAAEARSLGALHRIHPACIVTSYGFNMAAWGTAQNALKALGAADGGPEAVCAALVEYLDLDDLADTDRQFFARAVGLPE